MDKMEMNNNSQTIQTIQFDENGFALTSGEMTVYLVDIDGFYLQPSTEFIAEGTSLSIGAYLDEPPTAKDGYLIQRTPNGWQYVKDIRGTYYRTDTGEKVEIKLNDLNNLNELNELSGLTDIPRPTPIHDWNEKTKKWVINSEKAQIKHQSQQAKMWEQIKQKRYDNTHSGVFVSGNVNKWFHSDEASRIQYVALQTMANNGNLPEKLMWKTMDNTFVEMTNELLMGILGAMMLHETTDFANAEKHRALMLKAKNPLEYDYSGGWQAVFEGASV